MARSTGVYDHQAINAKELRESLKDVITNLSPMSTPLYSGLKRSTAGQLIHSWNSDAYAATTSQQTFPEGGEYSFSDLTAPTRYTNLVQEFVKTLKVSDVTEASDTVGGKAFERQKRKALVEWKKQVEWHLINGSLVSMASSTGAQLKGAINFIDSGNVDSYASLTTLTEVIFEDSMEEIYNDVDVEVAESYMRIKLKQRISSFTASNTRNISADDRRLVKPVDVIETDSIPMVKLFAHRDMPEYKVMTIVPQAFQVAYLIDPYFDSNIARTGTFKPGAWVGNLTLEVLEPKAGSVIANVKKGTE